MNIYQEAIKLIENNKLTLKKEECYDPQSGWSGMHYYVYDGNTMITDLSGNGYSLNDRYLSGEIKKIRNYLDLKNMNTIDSFKKWLDLKALDT